MHHTTTNLPDLVLDRRSSHRSQLSSARSSRDPFSTCTAQGMSDRVIDHRRVVDVRQVSIAARWPNALPLQDTSYRPSFGTLTLSLRRKLLVPIDCCSSD